MFEPLFTPLFSSLFSSLIAAAQRIFITLDSAQQGHFVYASTLVFSSGDTFEFEFLAPAATTSGNQYLCDGSTASDRALIILQSTGNLLLSGEFTMTLDGVTVTSGSPYPLDAKLYKVVLTFTGVGEVGVLGVRYAIEQFYDGILANPKATIGGVTTTNRLDQEANNSELSIEGLNTIAYNNIPTGAPDRELFTLNTTTTPNQWENADKSRIIQVA